MLTDRPQKIEVLVNNLGAHDHVKIQEPLDGLQALGVDLRNHEHLFQFSYCIRPHSIVIWQRQLHENIQNQQKHLQSLLEHGCWLQAELDNYQKLHQVMCTSSEDTTPCSADALT